MTVGEFIKEKREKAGYSMYTLGEKVGVSAQYINDIEKNKKKTPPTEETLNKISKALKLAENDTTELLFLAALERTPDRIKKELETLNVFNLSTKTMLSLLKTDRYLTIFSQLRKHINTNNIDISSLSIALNIDISKLNKLMLGNYVLDIKELYNIYSYLNLNVDIFIDLMQSQLNLTDHITTLMSKFVEESSNNIAKIEKENPQGNLEQVEHSFTVPVYESISAGEGCPCYGEIVDYFPVPNDIKNGSSFISYKVKGDSMEPEISSGDYVLVKLEVEPENGQLGVFNINDEYFVKRIKKYGDVKVLVSTNPNYKEIMATAGDVTSCLGKVVLVSKRY